jgi:hypothetical protein
MIDEIRENTEKISLLVDMYEGLGKNASKNTQDEETARIKMKVIKEQILKSTFRIKKILTRMESLVK